MIRTREAPLRVMVASEDPEFRYQITQLVEQERGVRVIEQVGNAVEAVARARALKPEVTLVDPYLPYRFGVDGVPLSRMSGLDAATSVLEDLPAGIAILLSNAATIPSRSYSPDIRPELCRYTDGFCVPLNLRHLQMEMAPDDRLVFANVWTEKEATLRHSKVAEMSDHLLVFGGMAAVVGFGLVLTLIMAIPGIALGGGGLAAILLGLVIKGVVKCMPGSDCQDGAPE